MRSKKDTDEEDALFIAPCPYCGGPAHVHKVTDIDDVIIWRYMDFIKFADLVTSKQLYFSRLDLLGDPYEGSYPKRYVEKEIQKLKAEKKEHLIPLRTIYADKFRRHFYANCWTISDYESAALWKQYLKSDDGIAVRSSRNRLGLALAGSNPPVFQVPIRYIDFETDEPNIATMFTPTALKRKSFEHERELRALAKIDGEGATSEYLGKTPTENGIKVDVNLSTLVADVIISPTAPQWIFGLTQRLCED